MSDKARETGIVCHESFVHDVKSHRSTCMDSCSIISDMIDLHVTSYRSSARSLTPVGLVTVSRREKIQVRRRRCRLVEQLLRSEVFITRVLQLACRFSTGCLVELKDCFENSDCSSLS